MKKWRAVLVVGLSLAFVLPSLAKDVIVQSKWTNQPVVIDGNRDDWAPEFLNNWKKFKIDYGFLNDGLNLYGIVIFNDRDYLSSIRNTGLTVWINSQGKKKKKLGVCYRLRQISSKEMVAILERREGALSEERKTEIMSRPQYIYYEGQFVDGNGNPLEPIPLGETFILPTFRMSQTQGKLIYEFRVPLNIKEFFSSSQVDLSRELRIGFEWGGMTKEMRAAMMKRRAEAEAQARGGNITSNPTEERGVRDFDSPLRRPKKYSFWVGVKLASQ